MDMVINMRIKTLDESQYVFLTQYLDMLSTVEEGFDFIHERYAERNFGQGDQLLSDIMGAFIQFNSSNMTLRSIFLEDEEVMGQLDQFQGVIGQVANLEHVFTWEEDKKVQFLSSILIPSYKSWKESIEDRLEKYHMQ
jgi:hypothetical protein